MMDDKLVSLIQPDNKELCSLLKTITLSGNKDDIKICINKLDDDDDTIWQMIEIAHINNMPDICLFIIEEVIIKNIDDHSFPHRYFEVIKHIFHELDEEYIIYILNHPKSYLIVDTLVIAIDDQIEKYDDFLIEHYFDKNLEDLHFGFRWIGYLEGIKKLFEYYPDHIDMRLLNDLAARNKIESEPGEVIYYIVGQLAQSNYRSCLYRYFDHLMRKNPEVAASLLDECGDMLREHCFDSVGNYFCAALNRSWVTHETLEDFIDWIKLFKSHGIQFGDDVSEGTESMLESLKQILALCGTN